ncbi:MAG TPA: hypothetical protein VM938_02565 [Acidimicrobiales bacterium]|nr:hypothetical protein [Acidimicrobiales bacterium]
MDGPRGADYLEALQFPEESFRDPELAAGAVELSALGLPRPVSGNVASVFKVTAPSGRAYAVRCFVRRYETLSARYAAVAQRLGKVDGTWKVGVDFQPEGVLVGDTWQPIVKMDWSEATPLLPWVEAHLWDTAALSYVAARFAAVVGELRAAGIAHGDLQHGNILVAPGGDIRLVDYDGMYVPEMARMRLHSSELGHRNYAHPGRTLDDFGPYLDAFPSWVVYASLAALSIDPLLWGRLDGGDECLLFRAADFADPDRSEAFACFESSGDARLGALASALRRQVALPVAEVEPLSMRAAPPALHLGGTQERTLLEVLRTATVAAPPAPAPVAVAPVASLAVEAAFGPEVDRHRRSLTAALALLAAVPFLGVAGVVPAGAAVAAALVGAAGAARLLLRQFHALPSVQASKPQQAALTARRATAEAAQRRVDSLAAARAAVDAEEQQAAAAFARLEDDFRRREQAELQVVDDELKRAVADVAAREQDVSRAERAEADDALQALHAQVLDVELANHRVVQAKLPGITDKVVYGLALDDIRTAADIADVVVDDEVFVVRPDGRRVRSASLGEAEARTLLAWRRRTEAQYADLLPSRLPVDRAAAIRAAYADKRAALEAEAAAARAAATQRADEARTALAAQRARRGEELQRAQMAAAARRLEIDRELGRARKDAAEAQFRLQAAEHDAGDAQHLTPSAYVRLLVRR